MNDDPDPAAIDAVAADRVLTGKMAASLHRIGSQHGLDNIDPDHDFTNDDLLTIARSGADYRFRRTDDGARRVAAGGTEAES